MSALAMGHSREGGNPGGFFAQLFALMRSGSLRVDWERGFALRRPYFSLLVQRKVGKRKHTLIRRCLRH
ncbi:MAG: hypothetical protein Q7J29_00705, partial [Stagnimonas sp.]|nr:hypothetical protein [Stagnimonas sp.]